jgi:hypothetical protein
LILLKVREGSGQIMFGRSQRAAKDFGHAGGSDEIL